MKIALVVAMARNGVIGRENQLPWHLPEDLKYFKSVTMGKPIIMGRKTYDSIGRPLPGRTNIVITRDTKWRADGVEVVHSLDQALALATEVADRDGVDELIVMGGGEIYRQSLERANRLYITEVDADVDGDARFPTFNIDQWPEIKRTPGAPGGTYPYAFVVRDKITA
ncbi:dihydrofolate reductase [Porticoccaceae bacterium LTM1]|nr:dihydrofolate reductase [Porticoccaceae bacterium LTM1]